MCKQNTKLGKQCKNKGDPYCHRHTNMTSFYDELADQHFRLKEQLVDDIKALKILSKGNNDLKHEIKNLNRTIGKKNTKISHLNNELDSVKRHAKVLKSQIILFKESLQVINNDNKDLIDENDALKDRIISMEDDFNNYQFIKKFEKIKFELSKYIDINNYSEIMVFLLQKKNSGILTNILDVNDDFYEYFNKLRLRRNKLSHLYEQ